MRMKDIQLKGSFAKAYEIELQNAKLILAVANKGYIMCGYLNLEVSDKFNDCSAVVKGVNSIEEMLAKEVCSVSKSAAQIGIKPGMKGLEALSMMI